MTPDPLFYRLLWLLNPIATRIDRGPAFQRGDGFRVTILKDKPPMGSGHK
jgi:hypothetical protein